MSDAAAYTSAVMTLLAEEFPDMREEVSAAPVRKMVQQIRDGENRRGEAILDSPAVANWKLVADPRRPRYVRVRYVGRVGEMTLTREGQGLRVDPNGNDERGREGLLNARLDSLVELHRDPLAARLKYALQVWRGKR